MDFENGKAEPDLNSNSPSDETENERGNWNGKIEYMLSMIGYCVGLGNIWRFPYICMRNGGGAFLIPFIFFLLVCGLPLFFLEASIGQFTGKGALDVWEVCPLFKGIGVGMIIVIILISLYYNIIIAWTLYYIGASFINPIPWMSCENEWNSPGCISDRTDKETVYSSWNDTALNITTNGNGNITLYNTSSVEYNITGNGNMYPKITSEEEYWKYKVLQISDGIHDIGGVPWHTAVCLFVAWIAVYLCLIRGIKSVGKVVYVTAVLPYILLTVILIRGLTLPGSLDGVVFYIRPDFEKLSQIQVWLEACLQVFYSMGPCWGTIITLASYSKFNNNCYRDAVQLSLVSEGTSIYGGFAVFTVLGFMAHKSNIPIEDVVQSGPGLGFIAYPEALALLPLPNFVGCAILLYALFSWTGLSDYDNRSKPAALESLNKKALIEFATVEVFFTALTDKYPVLRKRHALTLAVVCAVCFLIGLPMCAEGGMYIFQIIDWYIATLALPLFGILECIIFGWIYGAETLSRDIKMMTGSAVPLVFRILWCFITPAFLVIVVVFTFKNYKPPTYGDYIFPRYAEVTGWIIAFLPTIPLPICAGLVLYRSKQTTFKEKLKESLQPTEKWVPVKPEELSSYIQRDKMCKQGLLARMKTNILGHR